MALFTIKGPQVLVFDRVVFTLTLYMFLQVGVSRRIVCLTSFWPIMVYKKERSKMLSNFICLYCVTFLYISSENNSSIKWEKGCNKAGRNTPHNIFALSAVLKQYFKLLMLPKRCLLRNLWNISICSNSEQTDVNLTVSIFLLEKVL